MFSLIFSRLGLYIGAAVILAIAATSAAVHFHNEGVRAERQRTLERSLDVLRQRNKVDDKIRMSTDAELCAAIGGRWVSDDNESSCE